MTRNRILSLAIALIIIVLLVPYRYVSVFDGHYSLTITVAATDMVDSTSLQFATCWTDAEAENAIHIGPTGQASFETGKVADDDSHKILVPYSGRVDFFGSVASYNEPPYLVVQYNLTVDPEDIERKRFSIPSGRGPRDMRVAVP